MKFVCTLYKVLLDFADCRAPQESGLAMTLTNNDYLLARININEGKYT
jgi:hypothetical protein